MTSFSVLFWEPWYHWIPRFPNGRLGKIVPPLFGGISFPSGSFAIGKRVLGIFFQSVPKEAVDFVLESNQVLSVAVEVDPAEIFCDDGITPPQRVVYY